MALAGTLLAPWVLRALAGAGIHFCYHRRVPAHHFFGRAVHFLLQCAGGGAQERGGTPGRPLKFLAFSALLNAALDLVLIGGLGFGIVCSAVTTVAAEAASALMAALYMARRVPQLCPARGSWRIRPALLGRILQYGAVTALQQAVQPICKVLIQGQVNALGVEAIAAFNAVTRVDDFAFTPEQSIASAITTYIAQNRGAHRPERIRHGFAAGLRLELGYWVLVGALVAGAAHAAGGAFCQRRGRGPGRCARQRVPGATWRCSTPCPR